MTFIKPKNNNNFVNIALILIIVAIFMSAWKIISLNNKIVDLNHDTLVLRNNLTKVEAENTEIKIKILSLLEKLSNQNFDIAESRGLIQEKNPQYFKIDKKWLFASQY